MTIIPLLQTYYIEVTVVFICGAGLGLFLGRLLEKSRLLPDLISKKAEVISLSEKSEQYRIENQEQKSIISGLQADLDARHIDLLEVSQKNAAAESRLERLSVLETTIENKETQINSLHQTISDLKARHAELAATIENERKSFDEKTALLQDIRGNLTETHKAISADALRQNNRAFIDLAQATFSKYMESARTDFDARGKAVGEVIKPLKEALDRYDRQIQAMEKSRENAYGGLSKQIESLLMSQENLHKETHNLVTALRVPHVRGRWGEITLRRVAEMAGMQQHCDFFEQSTSQSEDGLLRPDMVVHLPGNRHVIIDAKVPLVAYLEALEAETDEIREERLSAHARHVATHIQKLSRKAYWSQFDATPEFVVLFIPGENFFSAALTQNPKLIERGVAGNVVLATPTTLISLLKTVAFGWQQEKMAENARRISELGTELFERISTMGRHVNSLGRDIERAALSYNKVVGSLERRVLSTARKFRDLGVSTRSDNQAMQVATVDASTRRIELEQNEKDGK
jgi:DNA recombination protein RmuC